MDNEVATQISNKDLVSKEEWLKDSVNQAWTWVTSNNLEWVSLDFNNQEWTWAILSKEGSLNKISHNKVDSLNKEGLISLRLEVTHNLHPKLEDIPNPKWEGINNNHK